MSYLFSSVSAFANISAPMWFASTVLLVQFPHRQHGSVLNRLSQDVQRRTKSNMPYSDCGNGSCDVKSHFVWNKLEHNRWVSDICLMTSQTPRHSSIARSECGYVLSNSTDGSAALCSRHCVLNLAHCNHYIREVKTRCFDLQFNVAFPNWIYGI